ncbi:MAG TPA: helix-turn-helix domain-containing protein [Pyrinomonadaceae bacterium]|jgi:transcriptional regulator with GAF, ATPase, and Fis domain|nr:helix-turn-helix domain-containing protein [Pyrinomonadaceae bacterium]
MNRLGNVRLLSNAAAAEDRRGAEDRRAPESHQNDTLIKAALSLSQAIEALGSLNFFSELRPPDVAGGLDFYREVRRFECALIREALRLTGGSQARACALLGLNPTTLNCMIKRYGIEASSLSPGVARGRRPRHRRARKAGTTPDQHAHEDKPQ